MRSQGEQFGPEGLVGALQRLHRHGRGHIGGLEQPVEVGAGQAQDAEHPVRPVRERQPLLGFEHEGGQPGRLQRPGRLAPALSVDHLPLADQSQGHVGEGGQVAAAPERAVLTNDGDDAMVEERDQAGNQVRPNAGETFGQGGGPDEDHGPHHLGFDLGPDRGGVRSHQPDLEGRPGLGLDVTVGQGTEAGRQPVHGPIPGDQLGGGPVRTADGLEGGRFDHHRAGFPGHRGHVWAGHPAGADCDRVVHEGLVRADDDDHVAGSDRIARLDLDLGHRPGRLGRDVVLHLHGFEDGDGLPGFHAVADRHQDLDDGALHRH